jgi:hypothetical protein
LLVHIVLVVAGADWGVQQVGGAIANLAKEAAIRGGVQEDVDVVVFGIGWLLDDRQRE